MGWWSKLFVKEAENWFYAEMPAAQTPDDVEIKEVVARKEYLTIDLKSMRITKMRKGFKQYYAAVNSFIALDHKSGRQAEINVITTPGKLKELAPGDLEKVIFLNQPLLGPIPYVGGNLEIQIGLFSIKSSDLTEPFLSLLTDMSSLAGVSFINVALPYAKTLKTGIDLITGSEKNTSLEIGLSSTYRKIRTGYYVIAGVPADDVNIDNLIIDKSYRLKDKAGKEITKFPYMILRVASSPERTDYFNIPEVVEAHDKLQEEIRKVQTKEINNVDVIKTALFNFQVAALTSNDLIGEDAQKIYDEIASDTFRIIDLLKGVKPSAPASDESPRVVRRSKRTADDKAKKITRDFSTKNKPLKIRSLKELKIYKKTNR